MVCPYCEELIRGLYFFHKAATQSCDARHRWATVLGIFYAPHFSTVTLANRSSVNRAASRTPASASPCRSFFRRLWTLDFSSRTATAACHIVFWAEALG